MSISNENFIKRFGVPDEAKPYIDAIVTPFEQRVISDLELAADGSFSAGDVAYALSCPLTDTDLSFLSLEGLPPVPEDEVAGFIGRAYARGVISYADSGGAGSGALGAVGDVSGAGSGTLSVDGDVSGAGLRALGSGGGVSGGAAESGRKYRVSDFYCRLDIFAVAENDAWHTLPAEGRDALDAWFFDAYYSRLDWSAEGGKPTDDRILTLDEAIAFLDGNEAAGRQIYLTDCDCRLLRGHCDSPTLVCLSYHDGPNSYHDRGISRAISVREARAVVTAANRAGLVHTANEWGMCNCCADCCYLMRARARRGSGAVWPESSKVVSLNDGECIGCGICLGRCSFGIFDESDLSGRGKASADISNCIGCGLCVETCPTGALTLNVRE